MNKIVLLIAPLHCEHFQMAITAVHRESRFKCIFIYFYWHESHLIKNVFQNQPKEQKNKNKAIFCQSNVEQNRLECVLKCFTFNDKQICNGMLLKVEAMILSSVVILFGWSLRLSFKLQVFLNRSRKWPWRSCPGCLARRQALGTLSIFVERAVDGREKPMPKPMKNFIPIHQS